MQSKNPFEALERREKRTQTPEFKPGLGSSNVWGGSSGTPTAPSPVPPRPPVMGGGSPMGGGFGSPMGGMRPPMGGGMGSPMGSPMGGGFGSPFGRPPMGGQQPQQLKDQVSQAAWDAGVKAAKVTGDFHKQLALSAKEHNRQTLSDTFAYGVILSGIFAVSGLFMLFLSIFLPFFKFGYNFLTAGLLGGIVCTTCFAIFRYMSVKSPVTEPKPVLPPPPPMPESMPDFEDDEEEDEESWDDEDEDDKWDEWSDEDDEEEEPEEEVEPVDYDSLEDVSIQPHTQTRAFLYEHATKGMQNMFPTFDKMKEIDENSADFAVYEELLQQAAEVVGTKEENLPEINSLRENYFVIMISITRSANLKVQAIAEEMANIYKYDDYGKEEHPHCFAIAKEFGTKALITLFKGSDPKMISLKDMYPQVKDKVLNPDVVAPVVLGTSADGEVYFSDFIQATSLVVSGPPRVGKSWVVKLILNQMATFMSPEDLEIYIGDPKDQVSDYADYDIPHVKRKEFTADGVLKMLNHLLKVEVPRRKKIFQEKGYKEIFEFRKNNPDVPMPFIYIALDEMVTLATSFEKKDKKIYEDLLLQVVSQMPGLGIRAIFIPHRVKDEIIPKNVYELIPYRITLKSSGKELLDNLGLSSPKDFPYQLPDVGSIGFRISDINRGVGCYGRSAVIAPNNTALSQYEKYIGKMWRHLCPDETTKLTLEAEKTDVDEMFDWESL